jgi:hypothetical protein
MNETVENINALHRRAVNDKSVELHNLAGSLPDTLSALMRVAMSDLERVENDANYRVDMSCWHVHHKDLCSVCLAGSVLTRTLDPVETYRFNDCFDLDRKLTAIDYARSGCVECAVLLLTGNERCGFPDRKIARYEDSPALFRDDINRLIRDLESSGL